MRIKLKYDGETNRVNNDASCYFIIDTFISIDFFFERSFPLNSSLLFGQSRIKEKWDNKNNVITRKSQMGYDYLTTVYSSINSTVAEAILS